MSGFGEFFRSGGFMMWPMTVAALLLAVAAVRSVLALRQGAAQLDRARGSIDGVLFWGAITAMIGVFGTIGGIANIASFVERSGAVPATLLGGGVKVAVVPAMAGLVVLLVALLAWYGLRALARRQVRA